jgi:hypothetical protein
MSVFEIWKFVEGKEEVVTLLQFKKKVYYDKFIIIYYSKGFKVYIKCTVTVYEQAYQSLLSLKINSTVAF